MKRIHVQKNGTMARPAVRVISKEIRPKVAYGEILLDQSAGRAMVIDAGLDGEYLDQEHCRRPSHYGRTFALRRCCVIAQNLIEEGGAYADLRYDQQQ